MAQSDTPAYTSDDQLDLCRDWDAEKCGAGREDLRAWLEKERPHLLRSYDAEFLLRAVEVSRARAQSPR
jgi:hypothetical protein